MGEGWGPAAWKDEDFGDTERERGYYSLCYRCHTRYSQREPETIFLFYLLYYVSYKLSLKHDSRFTHSSLTTDNHTHIEHNYSYLWPQSLLVLYYF